jgi:hypothetical protein
MKKGFLTAVAGLLALGSVATTPAFAWDTDRMPRQGSDAPYRHLGLMSPGGPGWALERPGATAPSDHVVTPICYPSGGRYVRYRYWYSYRVYRH